MPNIIAAYLAAVERGEQPDQDQLILENPQLASQLAGFFSNLAHFDKVAANELVESTLDSTGVPSSASPRIGHFKLLQRLGEGGMGEVWMAEQEKPVRRRVALKLIKQGMDSRAVLARFEAERQALALMNHPNIAKVFEAGIVTSADQKMGIGRPYFVMELVKGIPITEYCDQRRLSIHARLDLFRQSCSAVHHAHQKGIIHRDLKPGNILVENHDDRPVLKIIDFGLAKAVGGTQLTEQTLFTALGTVAGTPLYMAPEQAVLNALDIDIRADIFSLGVLLYELLTGSTPLTKESIKKKGLDELLKLIREFEPPVPSHRLSTSDALASIAAVRQLEPKRLGRFVRGELDWIVMKAMSKERERRYGSAIAFSEDIERFLNEEPVLAGPPSAVYQLRKFARRNRGPVIAGAAITGALGLGLVGTTVSYIRAERSATQARIAEKASTNARDAESIARKAAEFASYLANIALAQNAMTNGNYTEAKERLNACAESLRGFEWLFLQKQVSFFRIEFPAHDKTIVEIRKGNQTAKYECPVVASYDEQMVAIRVSPETVRIYDIRGNPISQLMTHIGKITHLFCSPEGKTFFTIEDAKIIQAWDVTGRKYGAPMQHEWVGEYEFLKTPDRLVTWDQIRKQLRIWNFRGEIIGETFQAEHGFNSHSDTVALYRENECVLVNPLGKVTCRIKWEWKLGRFNSCEISPSGKYVSVGDGVNNRDGRNEGVYSTDGTLLVAPNSHRVIFLLADTALVTERERDFVFWHFDGLKFARTNSVALRIPNLEYAISSEKIATRDSSKCSPISIWDESGRKIFETTPIRNTAYYKTIRFCEGGSRLAVQTSDLVHSQRTDASSKFQIVGEHAINFPIPGYLYSSEYATIRFPYLSHETDLSVWDQDGNRIGQASVEHNDIQSLAQSKLAIIDNRVVDLNAFDNGIAVLEKEPLRALEAEAILESFPRPFGDTTSSRGFKEHRLAITQYQVDVHDSASNKLVGSIKTNAVDSSSLELPTMNRLVVADGNLVRIFDSGSLREMAAFKQHSVVSKIECSGDGRIVILKFQDGTGRGWDIRPLAEKQAYWKACSSEFEPSKQYVKELWATKIPTANLMQSVLDDKSLTAIRRWGVARLLIEETELNDALAEELFDDLKSELPYQKVAITKRLGELREIENDWRKLDLVDKKVADWSFDRGKVIEYATGKLKYKKTTSDDNEKALAAIQTQLQLSPDGQDLLFVAGAAEFRLGRNAQAI